MSDEHQRAPQETGDRPEAGLRRSPMHDHHVAHGARFVEFAGWSMPLRYGSDLAEHHAVRQRAGVFDLSHMAELEVRGPAAAELLDHALVGNLSALAVGRARYTMICDAAGGILDDLVVYRRGPEDYLVVANAANASTVLAELEARAGGRAAAVVDATSAYGLVAVQGPRAQEILQRLTRTPLGEVPYYGSVESAVHGVRALVARTGYTGEDGFELFVPAEDAGAVFEALLDTGRDAGVAPAGLAARDSLRLEAGMPLYGNELSREVTPYEAGLGRVVRLDKPGDFVGREALERRSALGPTRELVGLVATGRRAPRHGYPVVDEATGSTVGSVTSGVLSPTLGRPVAMAYLDPAVLAKSPGLAVDVRGELVAVELMALPFYRRPVRRERERA